MFGPKNLEYTRAVKEWMEGEKFPKDNVVLSITVSLTYPHLHVRSRAALTSSDVQTDGAWVVVLEVGEGRTVLGTHLERDGLTCRTAECRDGVAVARHDSKSAEVLGDAGCIGVICCLGGRAAELGEVNGATAGEGVA